MIAIRRRAPPGDLLPRFPATLELPFVYDSATPATPLVGYPTFITNQVASNLVKGTSGAVCSAIFFGNWQELLIGMWSAIDILVDPYTGGTAGTVRVIAYLSADNQREASRELLPDRRRAHDVKLTTTT